MIPDDPKPAERQKLGVKSALGAIGVLIAGAVVLGMFTGSTPAGTATTHLQPMSPPDTGPTLTEQGTRLEWELTAELSSHRVLDLVEWNGETLLFASQWNGTERAGLDLLVLGDPGPTQPTTVIPTDYQVGQITRTPQGLVAVGIHPESGTPRVWVSTEGRNWAAIDLPDIGSRQISAHHAGDNLVVFGYAQRHLELSGINGIIRAVEERTGVSGWRRSGSDPGALVLTGPLGIPYRSVTPAELGIDPEDYPLLPGESGSILLVRDSSGAWQTVETVEEWPSAIFTGPDGSLWMGDRIAGMPYRVSDDGITWRPGGPTHGVSMFSWGQGWVRTVGDQPGAYSHDGIDWVPFDLPEFLIPASPTDMTWHPSSATVSEHGISMLATKQQEWAPAHVITTANPLTIERDGYVLAVSTGLVQLFNDDVLEVAIDRMIGRLSDRVLVEPEAGTITFVDEAGNELVRFGSEEIEELEREEARLTATGGPEIEQLAFLHSADGHTWTIQDLTRFAGTSWWSLEGSRPNGIRVLGDRFFLILSDRIWTAPIPES